MRPDCTPLKTCTKCSVEKPASAEFFYIRKDRPSGFKSECRSCNCARSRRYHEDHRESHLAYMREYDVAHTEEKAARRPAERTSQAAYRVAHREERNAYCHKYHETHRAKRRTYASVYNAGHKGMGAARSRNRRAREAASTGTHTEEDVASQLTRQRGRCYWCGDRVTAYDVDHVFPLVRGGSNGPENLVIACPMCNRRKHAKLPHEFSDRLC